MNKKYLGVLLFGALALASSTTFVSCSDYDDDIKNLQTQIDEQNKTIEGIESLIKNGSFIKGVTGVPNGVKVTLSNGDEFTITNGADGNDGTVWTISEDGYWIKDGEKTGYRAIGENGDNGVDGETIFYKPDGKGNFDLYKLDENGKEVLVKDDAVSYLEEGLVTAVKDAEYLTISGVETADGTGVVKISLTSDLRSLVFMPEVYLDGIETVAYPWIQTKNLIKKPGKAAPNHQDKTCTGLEDYNTEGTRTVCNYGPVWPVKYHMNPSNSNVKSEDVEDFYALGTDMFYTRAAASKYDVNYNNEIFENKNGILTVGMQIGNPEKLTSVPTKEQSNYNESVIALQVNSKANDATDGKITSDYALIRPQKTAVEGLVWIAEHKEKAGDKTKKYRPMYGQITASKRTELGDAICGNTGTKIHVWDNPYDCIKDDRKAAFELYYDSEEGITLSEYLGICYQQEYVDPNRTDSLNDVWEFGEEKKYGLTYEFKLIDYIVGTNKTADSRFAKIDANTGKIRAWNVEYDGGQYPEEGATSQSTIGREPLVQVLVKDNCGRVVLDGYILIHITDKEEALIERENKIIDWKDVPTITFDLCNGENVIVTNWSQFNDWVLTQEMNHMTKEAFDAQYEIDGKAAGAAGDGDKIELNVYKNAPLKGTNATKVTNKGTVDYSLNTLGTTNHTFKWAVDEYILESWTHDKKSLPVKDSVYVRYKAIEGSGAQYPYIYVKFKANFKRASIGKVKFGEKIDNYWFGLEGQDSGWEAIVNDVNEPRDGMDIKQISHEIDRTLVDNKVKNLTGKYYFAPAEYTIKAQDGTVYTVTPQSSASDNSYKTLYCKYYPSDDHVFSYNVDKFEMSVFKDELNERLNVCAIDYAKGIFANTTLYAKNKGVYTPIAVLNQSTGVLSLEKNDVTKAVLNAVGYKANHANISEEMRSFIGYVDDYKCDLAQIVEDNLFLASWQRPINLDTLRSHKINDATTNGCTINILDFIELYDWRGKEVGYMSGDQQWFWAYYGVKSITIDLRTSSVYTDMHGKDIETTKLTDVTDKVKLVNVKTKHPDKYTYTFDLTNYEGVNYNSASMSEALVNAMQNKPEVFGGIYYENNGENVTKFTVRIPVTISYEWGDLIEHLYLTIDRTLGN